jgi:hypothetical protein
MLLPSYTNSRYGSEMFQRGRRAVGSTYMYIHGGHTSTLIYRYRDQTMSISYTDSQSARMYSIRCFRPAIRRS